jgi:CCR4-NOT transcriptional regulation complex NOT5 subunit
MTEYNLDSKNLTTVNKEYNLDSKNLTTVNKEYNLDSKNLTTVNKEYNLDTDLIMKKYMSDLLKPMPKPEDSDPREITIVTASNINFVRVCDYMMCVCKGHASGIGTHYSS